MSRRVLVRQGRRIIARGWARPGRNGTWTACLDARWPGMTSAAAADRAAEAVARLLVFALDHAHKVGRKQEEM